MKNKKGFTLIELLAVIVVLAVIAIIAIPIITNVIDKAKQGALKDSAYGILDSAEMYLAKNMNKGIVDTMEFTCNNGKCLSGTEEINYKGKIESGKVRIYADSKIELCVTDNKSSALKTVANKKVEVVAGTCDYGELNYGVTALVSKTALDEANKKYNDLKALVDQTDITAEDIKEGKKAYSNGEVITGTNISKKPISFTNLKVSTPRSERTGILDFDLDVKDYTTISLGEFTQLGSSATYDFKLTADGVTLQTGFTSNTTYDISSYNTIHYYAYVYSGGIAGYINLSYLKVE